VEEEEEGAEQPSPPGCRVEGQRKRQRGTALAEKTRDIRNSQAKNSCKNKVLYLPAIWPTSPVYLHTLWSLNRI
jgi:hypothetical protein